METLAQSALFLSLVSFTFGVTALSRNFYSRVFQTFTLACLAISLWSFFFFLSYIWNNGTLYDLHLAMNAWLTAPVLLFLQYWTRTERWRGNRILVYASLLLSALLSILLIPGLERESLTKRIIYFTPTLILIQVLWFMIFDRKMRNLSELPRRGLLYGGTFLILVTCLMDHIPGLWVGISVFGNLALIGFIFFVRHNLLRQKFLHFDVFFGRFVLLLSVSIILTVIYSIVAVWVKGNFALFVLNSFLISFFLVNIIPPMNTLITYLLNLFLDDRVKALRKGVAETYSDILRIIEFDSGYLKVTNFLQREFRISRCTVLLYDPSRSIWVSLDHQSYYPDSHPVIEAHRARGKKLPTSYALGEEIEERQRAKVPVPEGFQTFRRTVGNFLVPLVTSEQKWVGVLGLQLRGKSEGLDECEAIFKRLADLLVQKQFFELYQDHERLATLGEVAAGLAHEIRNPLGAIKGAVQLLEESPHLQGDPLFRVILEETNRLNGFLTQFLEYSKPVPIEPEWFALKERLEYVRDVVKLSYPSLPVRLEWSDEFSIETEIYFGKQHFTQVILNLLRNSFHSLEKSKKEKKLIRIEMGLPVSNLLPIRIWDSGDGIQEENLRKIFIPFFTTDPSGTGLGLSISKKLMVSYGGDILVRSHWREWTEVELQFRNFRQGAEATAAQKGMET
jgi:two-component system, NtrC family, sensor histidine kinase HydH